MRPRVPVVVSKCGLSEWTLNLQTVAPEQSVSTNAAIAARGRLCKRHQNAFHRYLRKTISDGNLAPLATMSRPFGRARRWGRSRAMKVT